MIRHNQRLSLIHILNTNHILHYSLIIKFRCFGPILGSIIVDVIKVRICKCYSCLTVALFGCSSFSSDFLAVFSCGSFLFQYINTSETLLELFDMYDLALPLIHCIRYWAKVCIDCIQIFGWSLWFALIFDNHI